MTLRCAVPLQGIRLTTAQETCTRRPGRCSYTVVQIVVGNKVWLSAAGLLALVLQIM